MSCHMRKLFLILTLVLLFSFGVSLNARAQQWTAAQNEVWSAVSGMCDSYYRGDVEGLYKFVHRDLVWWNTSNDVPGNYAAAKAQDTAAIGASRKWLTGSCTPITIQVFDNFAVVNAYGRGYRDAGPGQDSKWETTRLHFVMKKEGKNWLQVANYLDSTQRSVP